MLIFTQPHLEDSSRALGPEHDMMRKAEPLSAFGHSSHKVLELCKL